MEMKISRKFETGSFFERTEGLQGKDEGLFLLISEDTMKICTCKHYNTNDGTKWNYQTFEEFSSTSQNR